MVIIDVPITDKNGTPLEIGDTVLLNTHKVVIRPKDAPDIKLTLVFALYDDDEGYYDTQHYGLLLVPIDDPINKEYMFRRFTYPDVKDDITKVIE